jgi:hypothetical protein
MFLFSLPLGSKTYILYPLLIYICELLYNNILSIKKEIICPLFKFNHRLSESYLLEDPLLVSDLILKQFLVKTQYGLSVN